MGRCLGTWCWSSSCYKCTPQWRVPLRSVYPLKGLHTSFCTGPPIGAEATLHSDSIQRVIVDSDRRMLVTVMSIGGADDERNLLGDGDLAAAVRHDGGHEPTLSSKHFNFRKPNQLELSRQES